MSTTSKTAQVPSQARTIKKRKNRRRNKNLKVKMDKTGKVVQRKQFEDVRQARGDPRVGNKGISPTLTRTNQQMLLPMQVTLQEGTIWAFAEGYITKALEKGFAASATNPWDPYFALVYLQNFLGECCVSGIPQAQQLPYALLAFGRALSPKAAGQSNGFVNYSWDFVTGGIPLINNPIGYVPYGYLYSLKWVPAAPTFAGGFPIMVDTAIPSYTPEDGRVALSSLNTFLAGQDKQSPFRMVPFNFKTSLDRDVSMFAAHTLEVGLGASGTASPGFGSLFYSEVPIFRPMLTAWNSAYITPFNRNRYANLAVAGSGDSCWLGGTFGHLFKEDDWALKRYTKFHCVDFIEFADVIAIWVVLMQSTMINDVNNSNTPDATKIQCPLSIQEMQMLLRNVLMTAFKDTQAGAQGLYPVVPTSSNDNQFVPFTTHAGTCFLQSVDMELPVPIIENIRCLVYRYTERSKNDKEFFAPVLGKYRNDALDTDNYQFTIGETTTNSFATGPTFKRLVAMEKGQPVYRPEVEPVISLVDGQCSAGVAAINNPKHLEELAAMWNQWLKDSGLTTYSIRTCSLGTEKGINALCSINMTRHWVEDQTAKTTQTYLDTRLQKPKYKHMVATEYAERLAIADTSQSVILQAPYEQVQSVWILPIIQNTFLGPQQNTLVPRWQAMMNETFLASYSSGFDGDKLSEMHATYAAKMIKARQAENSDWSLFFAQMSTEGRGGVLSGIVAGLAGQFFPSISGVAKTVADMLPV